MSETFDVNRYWLERGRTYIQERSLSRPYYRLQERFLVEVLRAGQLEPRNVLELGCGFGRITKLLASTYPQAGIAALDLSPDQLANARRYCDYNPRISFHEFDFYRGDSFPLHRYDLSIAIEVFMHHPPDIIVRLVKRLAALSPYVVNLDWSEAWTVERPIHVWIHDFQDLYRQAGLACAVFTLPQKLEDKQQKLFIAARNLTAEVDRLERTVAELGIPGIEDDAGSVVDPDETWMAKVSRALDRVVEVLTPGRPFILVDGGQTGDTHLIGDRIAIPFLEREGRYWGEPPDDATAIAEVERLRRAGAVGIAFVLPTLWWLEHYRGLAEYLRRGFRCVLSNDCVVVFDLRGDRP